MTLVAVMIPSSFAGDLRIYLNSTFRGGGTHRATSTATLLGIRGLAGRQYDSVEPQRFTDGPGLERAAPWRKRRFSIRDLRDVSYARRRNMIEQRLEEPQAGRASCLVRPAMGQGPASVSDF